MNIKRGNMTMSINNKLKGFIYLILYFSLCSVLYAQFNDDDIYISSGPDTIKINQKITYESIFEDWDDNGTYVDYWNWSINLNHSNEIYILASDDSVYGHSICQWTSLIDTLPFAYDSVKNDNFYVKVDCFDSDSFYHVEYKKIYFIDSINAGLEDGDFYNNLPGEFELYQNYPNPFNPTTKIVFELPRPSVVSFGIFNIIGEKIRKFSIPYNSAGLKSIKWDGKGDLGREVSSGVYVYQIKACGVIKSKKMILIR